MRITEGMMEWATAYDRERRGRGEGKRRCPSNRTSPHMVFQTERGEVPGCRVEVIYIE